MDNICIVDLATCTCDFVTACTNALALNYSQPCH